jgi:DNA-directed RNA polymerase specialized sigma subunit
MREARIVRAAKRVDTAEKNLTRARADFWQAVADANENGLSLSEIGRLLGVSRQRVQRIIAQRP